MDSIAFEEEQGKDFSNRIKTFFKRFKIGEILRKCNAYKERGIPVLTVFMYLFCLVFRNRSMYMDMLKDGGIGFGKDTVYRFKDSIHINWLRFTSLLSSTIIRQAIDPLTSDDRKSAFIVDDSLFGRDRSKLVELLARVYDHAHHKYVKGFRLLTLGWSDGVTFMPVNFCLLSTENKKNRYNEAREVAKQSYGAMIRELSQTKGTEVLLRLIDEAIEVGIRAKHVLFDTWFSYPVIWTALKKRGLDTVAMVKKADNILFKYEGKRLTSKAIYNSSKKRRGRANYLLSVKVTFGEENLPAKLVFIRNRNNRSEYLVLVCTDMSLSEEEIIRLYGKRWDIEVFFKTSKSVLKLTDECRSISYDAMCAQAAIVFTRYMFLALQMREDKDLRTAGPLFCLVSDELADISYTEALEKIELFLEKLLHGLNITREDMEIFFSELKDELPKEIVNFLDFSCSKAALASL